MNLDAPNLHQLSATEYYKLRKTRWLARTDLLFLCQRILGFSDAQYGVGQGVQDEVHGPLIAKLQKFPKPPDQEWDNYDKLSSKKWVYKPVTPMYDLAGMRRTLILDSRGHLKTTINATAHTIQWILNYPDIAIAIFQATDTKAQSILRGIKYHFTANPTFRELFPEHCPKKAIGDWGTRGEITSEAISNTRSIREATLMSGSLEKGMTGYHFDIMKFSDIVEPTNVITQEQIVKVYEDFQMCENLLVRPTGWIDVEGTRYNFGDAYGRIIEKEIAAKKSGGESNWQFYLRGCYKKYSDKDTAKHKFDIAELDMPDYVNDKDEKVPWWPQRWSYAELEKKRKDNPWQFNSQQRNNPSGDSDTCPFPVNKQYPAWITEENFRKVPIAFNSVTVDTADTQNTKSKFTAITVVGWDQSGRAYLRDVRHGRYLPDEIIFHIFDVTKKYKPISVKIEETAFTRGLMPSIRRAEATGNFDFRGKPLYMGGMTLPLEMLKRETDVSKTERILNTLQPWYMSGQLRFVMGPGGEPPAWWDQLIYELSRFPYYEYNDIIDALADQFQGREYFGRSQMRGTGNAVFPEEKVNEVFKKVQEEAFNKFLGITDSGVEYQVPNAEYWAKTGGL